MKKHIYCISMTPEAAACLEELLYLARKEKKKKSMSNIVCDAVKQMHKEKAPSPTRIDLYGFPTENDTQ